MKVRNFRCSDHDWARFEECAGLHGQVVSAWVRQRLVEAADLDLLLERRRREEIEQRDALKLGLTTER